MTKLLIFIFLNFVAFAGLAQSPESTSAITMDKDIIKISQELLFAVKTGDTAGYLLSEIKNINEEMLTGQLINDDLKKVFWINIYNAITQLSLSADAGKYKKRDRFFSAKQVEVAGKRLSLDDIEHGLLRRSKMKWSFGYLNKLIANPFEKKQRVDTLDYRIHFALNCGAKSCPPIAFYSTENINKQLDIATNSYLLSEVEYKPESNMILLPAIMGWFRADFGGKQKMKQMLKKLNIIPPESNPSIYFVRYDWSLFLAHYKKDD